MIRSTADSDLHVAGLLRFADGMFSVAQTIAVTHLRLEQRDRP